MGWSTSKSIGIAAIASYVPPQTLDNAWFDGTIARKFVHHTGITARPVSWEDEVTLAVRAVDQLQHEVGADLADCAGIVFASPSFVPLPVARRLLDSRRAKGERLHDAGRQLARRLRLPHLPVVAINWFCSGYAKALAIARRQLAGTIGLNRDQFLLVVTASRISRITDYGCMQTGPLFGDMATATLLARTDSTKYPAHFRLLHAYAEKQPANGVFFDFELRQNVLAPTADGGRIQEASRLVYSLDGMGIADAAPRAMTSAVLKSLAARGLNPADLQFVVPHQAGAGIVRLTTMKLEQAGVRGEVINGMTTRIGNVSSCSIPYALQQHWFRLGGVIACPTAAVGTPGKAEVSQGCVLLQSLPYHHCVAKAC